MSELVALRESCARLTEPDREVDLAVCSACGLKIGSLGQKRWRVWIDGQWAPLPAVSASVDAALGLVERLLPGAFVTIGNIRDGVVGGWCEIDAVSNPFISSCDVNGAFYSPVDGNRVSRPLAIILALLDALIALSPNGKTGGGT